MARCVHGAIRWWRAWTRRMFDSTSLPNNPLVLSLSKDRPSFGRFRVRHEEQERCFDKLSTNGVWLRGMA